MLIDNRGDNRVINLLSDAVSDAQQFRGLSGSLSVFGLEPLCRIVGGTPRVNIALDASAIKEVAALAGDEAERGARNRLDLQFVAASAASKFSTKFEIRSVKSSSLPRTNIFMLTRDADGLAIYGDAGMTASGLGLVPTTRMSFSTAEDDPEVISQLSAQFDRVWQDEHATSDATAQLRMGLEWLGQDQCPQNIYAHALSHLFDRDGVDWTDESIIRPRTGFAETVVWNMLYKFQRDGVLGAIDKLERFNGCIIADSVGLGKTFEALAVIKYFELRNDRVLVLCPKRLRDNWTVYTVNDKRNLLADDRFGYDVLNHTDLSRYEGKSGEINLATLNWGNYDLIVIDESHNFRNDITKNEGITRYQRLMQEVIKSGVKTKVLMLSATPVNNKMTDLKNQVAFITEGKDAALSEHGLASIANTTKRAEAQFKRWLKLPEEERTQASLLDSLGTDYFRLLDLLTIARSRRHIERYYDASEIGEFPERLPPKNVKSDIDKTGVFPALREINLDIKRLNLAAYAPLTYVRMDKQEEYSRKYDQDVRGGKGRLRQADREQSLVHLMRVNLLKRMESSISSFAMTVEKLHAGVTGLLEKIENHSAEDIEEMSIEDIEVDDPAFDGFLIGKKVKVLIQDLDLRRLTQELAEDAVILERMLEDARSVGPDRDAKLADLRRLIEDKVKNPLNADNKKIIVFSAFADTADYLYDQLANWARSDLGLHSAKITGASGSKTTLKGVGTDLNTLLTHFSPVSKKRDKVDPDATEDIDLLIATDCISEGQNLQDCDTLVNYDIHWNPVRIVQRFGRVDRLGSTNTAIQLVNFWPNMELDEYIKLEDRVSGRMMLLDISATGEDNVIASDASEMNDLDYRRKQIEQLHDNVVDLEDMDGSVSITDMTLNDFRMDLSGFKQECPGVLAKMAYGMRAVVGSNGEDMPPGAIFCLLDAEQRIDATDTYALAPYYLVYVSMSGDVVFPHTQAKKTLDVFKKLAANRSELDAQAIEQFNARTRSGKDMSAYRDLLDKAIESIVGKAEETGVQSLFAPGGTALGADGVRGIDDFEVVGFLMIEGVSA